MTREAAILAKTYDGLIRELDAQDNGVQAGSLCRPAKAKCRSPCVAKPFVELGQRTCDLR